MPVLPGQRATGPGVPADYCGPVGEPNVWSSARLPDTGHRSADVSVNGFELVCEIPADSEPEPTGATPFGLLAASLSSCTVMTVRTFLRQWRLEPGEVEVRVAVRAGRPPMMDRRVVVAGAVGVDLREQLSIEIDNTPVTRLLRDAITIRTTLTTG
jgi:putative redox protein